MKRILIILSLLIFGCGVQHIIENNTRPTVSIEDINIKKTSKSDKKILFVQVAEDGRYRDDVNDEYTTLSFRDIKYETIENKTGVFLGKYKQDGYASWLFQMDDGSYIRSLKHPSFEVDDESPSHLYGMGGSYFVFIEDYNKMKTEYIGKDVWLNQVSKFRYRPKAFIPFNKDTWAFERFDKVKIVDIETYYIGGVNNIWFIVEEESGERGKLHYDSSYNKREIEANKDYFYYLDNPLNPDWGEDIIEVIKNKKVRIGMTEYQAMISWGKPNEINQTITSYGVSEQWVYKHFNSNQYLYFENGILETIQD